MRYFHVTVTAPEELRDTLRTNQRDGYALLMKTAAEATSNSPATHATSARRSACSPSSAPGPSNCSITGCPLPGHRGRRFRRRRRLATSASSLPGSSQGLGRARARQAQGYVQEEPSGPGLPDSAWSKPWFAHCTPWGEGKQAVLDYLARYAFRVAITNARIVGLDDKAVTIRHKHRKSNRRRTSRIPGQEFMRRFLQHVLPKGLHKVRYFGLWHPANRKDAARARLLLLLDR